MALIIKGDMPTCFVSCEASGTGACRAWMRFRKHLGEGRRTACPILGEIPDKHGRLKDESVIIQKAEDAFCKLFPLDGKNKQEIASEFYKAFLKAVFDAPVVVEATE